MLLFSAEGAPNEKVGCTSAVGPPNEKADWVELELAAAGVPNSNTGRGALEEGAPYWKTGCGKPSTEADAPIEKAAVGGLLVAASAPSEKGGSDKLELSAKGLRKENAGSGELDASEPSGTPTAGGTTADTGKSCCSPATLAIVAAPSPAVSESSTDAIDSSFSQVGTVYVHS